MLLNFGCKGNKKLALITRINTDFLYKERKIALNGVFGLFLGGYNAVAPFVEL